MKRSSNLSGQRTHRLDELFIETPQQWRAFGSVTRVEILDAVGVLGPCSLSEVAAQLGRRAASLYHHVRLLEKAGLLRKVGRRHAGRTMEWVYDRTASEFRIRIADPTNAAQRRRCATFSAAYHRMIGKKLTESMNAGLLRLAPQKNFASGWDVTWLTDRDVAAVMRSLRRIGKVIQRGRSQRRGNLYLFGFSFCPTVNRAAPSGHAAVPPRSHTA